MSDLARMRWAVDFVDDKLVFSEWVPFMPIVDLDDDGVYQLEVCGRRSPLVTKEDLVEGVQQMIEANPQMAEMMRAGVH